MNNIDIQTSDDVILDVIEVTPAKIEVDVVEFLAYLAEYRTVQEIRARFLFSNSEWYHYKRWLLKGKYITCMQSSSLIAKKRNRDFLYIAVKSDNE